LNNQPDKYSENIGVFLCECGPNIKDAIDIDELVTFVNSFENIALVKTFGLLCSDNGKELIKKEIKEHNLKRVVIAACSPKEHEITFRKVLEDAGLNPFLLHIANIREQCAWVIKDRTKATQKAKAILNASIKRVAFHEPLEIKEIECNPDVLVVGAGVAGISAALTLAQKNRKVYLVERKSCIGGKVALYQEVFPNLECASCMLAPKLDQVLHNENIELMTCSEVTEALGFFGNFIFNVKSAARSVDTRTCIGCGACLEVCPVKVRNEYNEGLNERRAIYIPYAGALPNAPIIDREHCLHFIGQECNACQNICPFGSINFNEADKEQEIKAGAAVLATGFDLFDVKGLDTYGYGAIENVYTGLEFERLLNSGGPTCGKMLLKNGSSPKNIALVHCAGSRTEKYNEYCSGVCCSYLLKFARLIKNKMPDASILEFYSDLCLPGKDSQKFFNKLARQNAIKLIHIKNPDSITISEKNNKILIKFQDVSGKFETVASDMVILAPSLHGAIGNQEVARIFDISSDRYGFFIEEHSKLSPVSTTTKGIFIAGCTCSPMDIESSVTQGEAAAGLILSGLVPGEKLVLEAMIAVVDKELCSGCKICIGICPFRAITYSDEDKFVAINQVMCRGCGNCACTCPAGAITARHFTDKQIYEEIISIIK
jgi:heterodisulfide reductase subunit A